MTIAVRPDDNDWWWVECDCGHRRGPFVNEDDAIDDAHEHDCAPTPPMTPTDGYIAAITPDGRVWDVVNGEWEARPYPKVNDGSET